MSFDQTIPLAWALLATELVSDYKWVLKCIRT